MWDVFISHASEDKEDLVRPLALRLVESGLKVWFDEFSLLLGDGLRRSIDKGVSESRFGLVVLSPHFFEKAWPQRELDALTTIELAGGGTILPIWHNVTVDDVRRYSPALADKVAVSSKAGLETIVRDVLRVVRPADTDLTKSIANPYDTADTAAPGSLMPPTLSDHDRLLREVRLTSEIFENLELHLQFGAPIDWRDEGFLSGSQSEVVGGSWVRKNRVVICSWRLSKLKKEPGTGREVLYVDERQSVIRDFLLQNQPSLLSTPPTEIEFVGTEEDLSGYRPSAALFFTPGNEDNNCYFDIETSPQAQLSCASDDEIQGLVLGVRGLNLLYAELLGTELSLFYRFKSADWTDSGTSMFDRIPGDTPFFGAELRAVDLYLNHRLIKRIYEFEEGIQARPNSVWDLENDNFYSCFLTVTITRQMIVDAYDPSAL